MSNDEPAPLEISVNLTSDYVTITDPNQSPQYAERGEPVVIFLSMEELRVLVNAYEILTENSVKNGG